MLLKLTLLAGALLGSAAPAFAADCAAVVAAKALTAKTPHKWTETHLSPDGKTRISSAAVETGGKTYMQINEGSWFISPTSGAQAAANIAAYNAGAVYACEALGPETLKGEAADVFHIQSSGVDNVTNEKVWVSRSTKLVLKIASADGAEIQLYDYAHIGPPPGFN